MFVFLLETLSKNVICENFQQKNCVIPNNTFLNSKRMLFMSGITHPLHQKSLNAEGYTIHPSLNRKIEKKGPP